MRIGDKRLGGQLLAVQYVTKSRVSRDHNRADNCTVRACAEVTNASKYPKINSVYKRRD